MVDDNLSARFVFLNQNVVSEAETERQRFLFVVFVCALEDKSNYVHQSQKTTP